MTDCALVSRPRDALHGIPPEAAWLSKLELGTRAAVTLRSAAIVKCLHDEPFGCLRGLSLEVMLHTVYLAWKYAAAS